MVATPSELATIAHMTLGYPPFANSQRHKYDMV
jgi:hypothetical protein